MNREKSTQQKTTWMFETFVQQIFIPNLIPNYFLITSQKRFTFPLNKILISVYL